MNHNHHSTHLIIFIILLIIIIVVGGLTFIYAEYSKKQLAKRDQTTSLPVVEQFNQIQDKISYLEEQINLLRQDNIELKEKVEQKPKEIIRREIIREKSQDELLTEAVAKITPTVVSIVATKDVPLLVVEYINPFGDDPFFKDFNFRIPTYKQKGTTKQEIGSGTGFIVSHDGQIITNRHVVADPEAEYTILLADGAQNKAQVVKRDSVHDLAMLKIEGSDYQVAELGDSAQLKLGQSVFAVGNALGEYSNSVSVGIVSGLNRDIQASGLQINDVIQTDAAINPGNSGGPLVNLTGQVIGVNVATVIGSENIGFAIPVNEVKGILNSL